MVEEGCLKPPYRDVLPADHDFDRLLARCADYRIPDYTWGGEEPLPWRRNPCRTTEN
ncbi:hypothetical protein ACQPYE_15230 [Actinosynnema sp. CA-299493]